jgi:cell wall-associated NlpC family hydrolase
LHSSSEAFWGLDAFADSALFGQNLRPRKASWWKALVAKADPGSYPNAHQKAITLRTTHMRVLPTREPAFFDPSRPGQGYPFDMLQNSVLWANTPVLISHRTPQRDWYLVETEWAIGWVPARDVAFVSRDTARRYETGRYLTPVRDRTPVHDASGLFRFQARIGSLLPLKERTPAGPRVLIAVCDDQGKAVLHEASLPASSAAAFPLDPQRNRVAALANELLGQPYGWGGLYGRRDCSSTLRDLFAPFGIWLPRNSAPQASVGETLDLQGLSAAAKQERITERGAPFFTLLGAPGHIMLYIGRHKGRPMVFHTMWGVKTWGLFQGPGRRIVGSTAITSLTPGMELPNLAGPDNSLLSRITSMTLLPPRPSQAAPQGRVFPQDTRR